MLEVRTVTGASKNLSKQRSETGSAGAVKLKRLLGQDACDWNHCLMHDAWKTCLHTHSRRTALLSHRSLSWQIAQVHCRFVRHIRL